MKYLYFKQENAVFQFSKITKQLHTIYSLFLKKRKVMKVIEFEYKHKTKKLENKFNSLS